VGGSGGFLRPPRASGRQDAGVDEAVLEVVEILGQRRLGEELVHDGDEVLEASNGVEAMGVGAKRSSCDGHDEGVLDDVEADAAAIEGERGAPVLSQDAAQGSREPDVLVEHESDVARLGGFHATSGRAAWT
jgi:hypothetical protein